jgi:hypothetical protein
MLRDKVVKNLAKGLPSLLLGEGPSDIAGHRIRPARTYLSMNSGKLFVR